MPRSYHKSTMADPNAVKGVETFNKGGLKHVEVKEKNVLPSKE